MWTPSGQLDLHTFMGMRGGGGKGGGGGGQSAPQAKTYVDPVDGTVYTQSMGEAWGIPVGEGLSAEQQLNQHVQQRQAQEKAASDAAAAAKTQAGQQAETDFTGRRQSAYNDALAAVQRRFQLEGVDPNTYMASDIQPTLQRQFNSVQDLDPNPSAAFPTSIADDILGNITSGRRTSATNQLNSIFTPTYSQELLPDSTVDQYAGSILDEQFNPLASQLQNAFKRHTLNDTGYKAATDALGQKRSAGLSQIQNLGRGILSTDRSAIDDLISGARSTASGLTLGQQFDPNAYKSQAESRAQSELGSFGGELRNAVGGTKFADLTELLNAGGAVQGATNPNAANPSGGVAGQSPFFTDPNEEAKKQRGLGNTGAF